MSGHVRCLAHEDGEDWILYHGDCVDVMRQIPSGSVDISVFSPPFSNLYCYSDSTLDMGNCADDQEFLAHYRFLVDELHRVLRPGRICAVHCKDLVNYAGRDGMAGIRDFSGDLIRIHQAAGFALAAKITIWRCPVTEQRKTNRHALLYKQLRTDSTFSAQGLPEYLLVFRRWANPDEGELVVPIEHTRESFPLDQWQRWAEPVWMDLRHAVRAADHRAAATVLERLDLEAIDPGEVNYTNVLNVRAARDGRDEKHMCPLPLDIIRRCLLLWSRPGEVVLSPFAGVGSEGYVALREERRFVGIELKESYFRQAALNLRTATAQSAFRFGP